MPSRNFSVVNDATEPRLAAFNLALFKAPDMRPRIISAVVLIPVALGIVYLGGWSFDIVLAVTLVLAAREWISLAGGRPFWLALGLPYLGGFGGAMLYLRALPEGGRASVYYLLVVVWATDSGAFLAGRLLGGPKLAPAISPNKTWAGFIGGVVLAGFSGYAAARCGRMEAAAPLVLLSVVLAVISQMGDLFESWLKRHAGVKESGHLIPGHGGVLDRIDGLVFAAIAFGLFVFAALGNR